ncbi:prostaglandin E2 receptor EP3 subtype [Pimephales promelas]|nr:prostaglandin E2 receptor EP3 subtype [Pimephales promelas]
MASKCQSSDVLPQNLTAGTMTWVKNVSKSSQDRTGSGASCGSVSVFFPIVMMITGIVGNSLAMLLVSTSAMAIERALAITAPHWYSHYMKTSVTKQVLMLKMISTHTSSHQCGSAAVSLSPQDLQMDCNFFLTAIRLASLNQILDPWVYLLLREILLKKFCQVASAVSNCSLNVKKETQSPDALNKKAIQNENVHKQSLNMENSNLNGGQEEQ